MVRDPQYRTVKVPAVAGELTNTAVAGMIGEFPPVVRWAARHDGERHRGSLK
jgi:hypothetical protein